MNLKELSVASNILESEISNLNTKKLNKGVTYDSSNFNINNTLKKLYNFFENIDLNTIEKWVVQSVDGDMKKSLNNGFDAELTNVIKSSYQFRKLKDNLEVHRKIKFTIGDIVRFIDKTYCVEKLPVVTDYIIYFSTKQNAIVVSYNNGTTILITPTINPMAACETLLGFNK